jgi:Uma2 family endonuclease
MTLPKTRTWQDVLDDPNLQDLPYKIELDEKGQLLMSAATNVHGRLQSRINDFLRDHLPEWVRITECSIMTTKGVRVADVASCSVERADSQAQDLFTTAPEICVEIVSPSNRPNEIKQKIGLYLAAGALEVWTCSLQGEIKFFVESGELEQSVLAPGFPAKI